MGNSEKDIKKICANANLTKGLAITGSNAENSSPQIKKWLQANNIN